VQLARAHAQADELSEAVVRENCTRLRELHLEHAAQLRPAFLRMGLAAALVGVGAAFWVWQPAQFFNSAARIFLPLASIEPIYRTKLIVEPGDIEAAGNVPIQVTIQGVRPEALTIIKRQQGKTSTEIAPVPDGDDPVSHLFRDVAQSFTYAVRGGDFTTPFYQVTVPARATLSRLQASIRYPAYTNLGDKTVENTTGEIEALEGSHIKATFIFDRPIEKATLFVIAPSAGDGKQPPEGGTPTGVELARGDDGRRFSAELDASNIVGYRLTATLAAREPQSLGPFSVRLLKDQNPKLELTGLDARMEVQVDSLVPLQVSASDDFGLEKIGLFHRRMSLQENQGDDGWLPIATWQGDKKTTFRSAADLALAKLEVVEGDRIELALRAIDTDPAKQGRWVTGAVYELTIGGDGVGLQIQYEQILRSDAELKSLHKLHQSLLADIVVWLRKLEGAGDLRWDDPKNVAALHAAVREAMKHGETLRQSTGGAARNMVPQAGSLRLALGLLADTEIVRLGRILDSVATRAEPQAKRIALADARVTQDRILRSFDELLEQYAQFRSDWELNHMIPFTKMLAERQGRMRDQSKQYATKAPGQSEAFLKQSMSKRQTKVSDLCKLIQPAFAGLAGRVAEQEPPAPAAGARLIRSKRSRRKCSPCCTPNFVRPRPRRPKRRWPR
jgi:hypothetical protein